MIAFLLKKDNPEPLTIKVSKKQGSTLQNGKQNKHGWGKFANEASDIPGHAADCLDNFGQTCFILMVGLLYSVASVLYLKLGINNLDILPFLFTYHSDLVLMDTIILCQSLDSVSTQPTEALCVHPRYLVYIQGLYKAAIFGPQMLCSTREISANQVCFYNATICYILLLYIY